MNVKFLRQSALLGLIGLLSLLSQAATATQVSPWTPIFKGIDYATATNTASDTPGPLNIFTLRISLHTPGISFTTTPSSAATYPGFETFSQTTSDFVSSVGAKVGINANFFSVVSTTAQPENLSGLAVSSGQVVSLPEANFPALILTQSNVPSIVTTPANYDTTGVWNAVAGSSLILQNGVAINPPAGTSGDPYNPNPRSALGISQDNAYLYMMVIDGRTTASVGCTQQEAGAILALFGAYNGMNLDGGGSSALVKYVSSGVVNALNSPSGGSQRLDGNNIAVFADALPVTSVPVQPYSQTVAANAPVAWYRFNETTSTTAADSSGNARDGTYPASGVTKAVTDQPIKNETGTSATFNGAANTHVNLPYTPAVNAGSFTVEAWAKPTSAADSFGAVVSNRNDKGGGAAGNSGYILYFGPATSDGGSARWQFWTGGNTAQTYTALGRNNVAGFGLGPVAAINAWSHVVGTFSATSGPDANGRYTGTQSLYVNGALSLTLANASYQPNAARPLYIGAGSNELTPADGVRFIGGIDEVAIYNTALTPAQIQAHYTSGITTLSAPTISLSSPADDASIPFNTTINLVANAADSDGSVTKVEFFDGATKLGEVTSAPFSYSWTGATPGVHAISLKATDDSTLTTTSATTSITVTNIPPTVSLTAPAGGASYTSPATVSLTATATDTDGVVAKVAFYADQTKLGESTTAPYSFTWNNAPAGAYSLTAVATDDAGTTTTSAAVSITIATPPVNFSFTENFNSMGTTGTSPPTGWSIKQGASGTTNSTWTTTIPGSGVAAMVAAATPLTAATAPSTSSGSNNGYNAQGTSSSDRVLATSPTSVAGSALQLSLTNNAGAAFSSITIGYDTRRYTAVATANELPGYWLFYSLDNGTTWTNVSALNPTISTVPNTVGVTNTPATAVALSAPWAAGATLLLRWVDDNAVATSPDQTLGLDNVTVSASAVGNVPPAVSLTSPVTAATFDAPATISLAATASDTDGTISKVEFYNGATLLGTATTSPYTYAWTGVFSGSYSLTAKATDNIGAITTSSAVSITVTNTDNTLPSVSITSPAAGAPFTAPASVSIAASASDSDGTISKVEFYNGANLLGQATTAPYIFNWTSVAAGTYNLTAKATDNDGGTTTSAAVSVNVSGGSSIISLNENFDSMGSNGTALPSGWSYYSLSGSHEDFIYAPPAASTFLPNSTSTAILVGPGADTIAANATLTAVTGPTTQKGAGAYNFSLSATPGDRCVGTSPSGNSAGEIQWSLTNTTGGSINSFSIGYDIRRFSTTTNNNATYDTSPYKGIEEIPGYWLFYSLDNGVTWTNVSALNPTIAGPTGVIVPNSVGVTTVPSTTVSLSGSWASGGTLLLRWFDDNAESPSPDQIIGLDNVTFAAGTVVGSAPTVALTSPTAGATFTTPATVTITATAADSDGTITKVEFYNGATLLGSATAAPYTFNWTGVVAGSYSLTARATDNDGNVTASTAVAITVTPSGTPPSVAITAPTASASFTAPATINITATATDTDGTITKVEFYSDTTLLGSATTAPYSYAWTNVAAGSYNLIAKATDSNSNVATSAVVVVTVDAAGAGSGTLTRGPYLQKASPTAMTVRWRSSLSVTGRVRYGTSAANLTGTVNESSSTTEHEVRITGLTAATTYFYSIGSANDTLLGDTTTTFTTPPVPGPAVPTRVWVLGDAGTSSANQTAVRDAFYNWTGSRTPDMVLQLGDNAYNSGLDSEFQTAVFNMYTTMLRKTPFWSCLGNHETNQATSFVDTYPYFNIYSFPTAGECGGVASGTEHYYSWDYGNIHFISLDSMTAGRTSTGAQATWLTNDLASTTATWIIVIFHHPPYTKGSHNSDSETELIEMRQNILPILEKGGVDLVLSGHSHCYERSYLLDGHYGLSGTLTASMKKNAGNGRVVGGGAYIKPLTGPRDHFGTVYCVTGSAGQISGGSLNHPANFISLNNLGSTVLDINGTRLDLTFLRENSTTPDTFTMIKQGAADSDGDGVPDAFELAHGMNRFDSSDATKKDANGLDARSAYLLGVEPGSGNTYHWSTSAPDAATGAVTVTFPTLADHKYQVFWSTDLSTWTAASAVVVGDGNAHTWTDDGTVTGSLPGGQNGQRFYRVQVGSYP